MDTMIQIQRKGGTILIMVDVKLDGTHSPGCNCGLRIWTGNNMRRIPPDIRAALFDRDDEIQIKWLIVE